MKPAVADGPPLSTPASCQTFKGSAMSATLSRVFLALIAFSLATPAAGDGRVSDEGPQAEKASIPEAIYAWGKTLQFVSLDRAVSSAGEVDEGLLGPTDAELLRRSLRAPAREGGCVDIENTASSDIPPDAFQNLESSLIASDHVLIGRVLATRPGYASRLGHIVRIETVQALKGSPLSDFYLFFPTGRLNFQGRTFCVTHRAYPALPRIGDRLLIMHQTQLHGPLLSVFGTQIVLMPQSGPPLPGSSVVEAAIAAPGKSTPAFETSDQVVSWAKDRLQTGAQ
ncbi:MAG: hypothetical protein AAFX50_12080 [Acidobacteriota bacterium]